MVDRTMTGVYPILSMPFDDEGRIDTNFGGITGCQKAVHLYEGFGIPCEMHVGGFGNAQILGSTTEETCEFYERGLLRPGEAYDVTPPHLPLRRVVCGDIYGSKGSARS